MIAGSNPRVDVAADKYPTEYRVEWLSPPYLAQPRPTYKGLPLTIDFNAQFVLQVTLPAGTTAVSGTYPIHRVHT